MVRRAVKLVFTTIFVQLPAVPIATIAVAVLAMQSMTFVKLDGTSPQEMNIKQYIVITDLLR